MSRPLTRTLPWLLALSLTGTLAAAQNQPLAQLAPAEAFLTYGFNSGAEMPDTTLMRDLNALGWEQAGKTLKKLGAFSDDPDFHDIVDMYGEMMQGYKGVGSGAKGSKFGTCVRNEFSKSDLNDTRTERMEHSAFTETLATVGASSYSPVPAITVLARVAPALEADFTGLQSILVRCSARSGATIKRLREGKTPLLVIGDASDFPVVVSRIGTLFIAGTNPEAVRGVVRRAHGSAEPSLGGTPFYRQNATLLTRPGLSLAINAAALGNTTESLGASFGDPQSAPLIAKTAAALRTLGSYAGTLGFEGNTLTLESQLSVNPRGGDPKLAALLLASAPAPTVTIAPKSSYALSSTNIPWKKTFDYLDDWTRLVGKSQGQALNLRQLARSELGVDLDTAIFDWLGDTSQSVVLEPLGTDLTPYLYGQAQVIALKTRGQAKAEAGYAELSRAARRLLAQAGPDAAEGKPFLEGVSTHYRFSGIDITRTRAGLNLDIGTAFLGDTLLIGMPAEALEPVISAAQGYSPVMASDEAFGAVRAAMPAHVTGFSYSLVAKQLQGFSDLTRLFSQPLAFAALAGLSQLSGDAPRTGTADKLPTFAELLHAADLIPNTLEVLAKHTGEHSSYSHVEGNRQRSVTRLEFK